jgi:hypothetical protein
MKRIILIIKKLSKYSTWYKVLYYTFSVIAFISLAGIAFNFAHVITFAICAAFAQVMSKEYEYIKDDEKD